MLNAWAQFMLQNSMTYYIHNGNHNHEAHRENRDPLVSTSNGSNFYLETGMRDANHSNQTMR